MRILFIFLMLLGSLGAQAGDAAYYESLGFSKDGKYYAFLQQGNYDGSGINWVELGIIDVKANSYMGRELMTGAESESEEIPENEHELILKKLKKNLGFSKYGFSNRPIQEVKVFRPNNDLTPYTETIFSFDYWASGGASATLPGVHLLLKEVAAPWNEHNEWCKDWIDTKMIELRINGQETYSYPGFEQDLQIDTYQPKIRACSFDYQIRYVFMKEESLAVALRFREPGFEGPNERFMVVTGDLK